MFIPSTRLLEGRVTDKNAVAKVAEAAAIAMADRHAMTHARNDLSHGEKWSTNSAYGESKNNHSSHLPAFVRVSLHNNTWRRSDADEVLGGT
jgi:hypothetical protein